MDYHNGNSPAFPYPYTDGRGDTYWKPGLTKRELIASQILASLAKGWPDTVSDDEVETECDFAARVADRLLHHLSKSEP